MATTAASGGRARTVQAKHILFLVFGLMTLFVLIQRDSQLFHAGSFLRQRYAPLHWLIIAHGVPGAIALFLGIFQFSGRLRQRYLWLHRIMGRTYVVCVAVAAPVAVKISSILVLPTLLAASAVQAFGWVVATGTALYCVRTGRIQQHREWMMRSYPFAMVFVVVRVILAVPAVERMGQLGIATTVWTVIAAACFLPSFVIAWQGIKRSKPAAAVAQAAPR